MNRKQIRSALLKWTAAFWTALGLVLASPALAAKQDEQSLLALQLLDQRVSAIGYRLATASRDLCPTNAALLGIVPHDLSQYDAAYRDAAHAAFGLDGFPALLAVAPQSPADKAGLRAGDTLLAINETPFLQQQTAANAASFDRTEQVLAVLEQAADRGPVRLRITRGATAFTVTLQPEPGCPSRFQVIPGRKFDALANGYYVQITSAYVEWTQDDDELAAILAHELAHNIAGHRARLDAAGVHRGIGKEFGKNVRLIRQTEIEADQLSVRILDKAGYPPEAAAALWARLGPRHAWGPFNSATHPGWKQRMAAMAEAARQLRAAKNNGPVP